MNAPLDPKGLLQEAPPPANRVTDIPKHEKCREEFERAGDGVEGLCGLLHCRVHPATLDGGAGRVRHVVEAEGLELQQQEEDAADAAGDQAQAAARDEDLGRKVREEEVRVLYFSYNYS